MAGNLYHEDGDAFLAVCSDPATPASGDPCLVGQIPAVAQADERTDGQTSIKTNGIFKLSVRGHDGSANAAITAGAIIYYNAGDTPKLNVRTAGIRYGYVIDAVASGATATTRVKLGY